MENNSNKSGKLHETVTLILKEEGFVVDKHKLINKSQYFAALLSANYLEYGQTEHVINYDISLTLLQDFIDWVHNDKIAFTSATSNSFEELDRLLILLELSVLFAADYLVEDISNEFEKRYMLPKYAINIWLLAQELNINILRDLALALCLDRFDELPFNLICELSRENFMKLIGNINIRSTESYFNHIIREWMNQNHVSFNTIPLDILRNKKVKILHSIISCEYNNREQFIHCWDGNNFFELTSFEYPIDIIEHCCSTGKYLEGMQITGRRYDLYLCGGEYGIGSGRFNKNVWRYSLISKKWFLETVMPVERRHMITIFVRNKLLLVGGVGRYRQKLRTIDIYDIYTGTWTSGAEMHFEFTNVPEHFIFNDKLIIYQYVPTIYIYFPDKDVWAATFSKHPKLEFSPADIPILTFKTMPCYIDVIDRNEMVLRTITEKCNVKDCNHVIQTLSHTIYSNSTNERKRNRNTHEVNLCYSLTAKCNEQTFYLTPFFREYDKPAVLLCTHVKSRESLKILHLHSIPIRNPRKFQSLAFIKKSSPRRFFNLMHPAYLHTINFDHFRFM